MINNKTITLLGVGWGRYIPVIDAVLSHCNSIFPKFDSVINYNKLDSLTEYNRILVEDLNQIINTDYVLTVQPDGYILNPNNWLDEFLQYDYVGAPWPWHGVCGNGGFSLRSKKFIQTSAQLKYDNYHHEYPNCPEDYFMCVQNRNYFLDNNILFSPPWLGIRFSFEHPIPGIPTTISDSFGFHGKHNLKVQ
jgi:hypothetical protein